MRRHDEIGVGQIVAGLALFFVIGFPMAAYLWSTLNDALTGTVALWRLGLAVPVLALFIGLLTFLARRIEQWEAVRPGGARHTGGTYG